MPPSEPDREPALTNGRFDRQIKAYTLTKTLIGELLIPYRKCIPQKSFEGTAILRRSTFHVFASELEVNERHVVLAAEFDQRHEQSGVSRVSQQERPAAHVQGIHLRALQPFQRQEADT